MTLPVQSVGVNGLVLSLFPGIGLLDLAFEQVVQRGRGSDDAGREAVRMEDAHA